mmetsp:Transcript_25476/g.73679  ORF Transcript_25476/g.73679 Transcript_25476/m.73679 type:complete len:345 (+) Transcript_25476:1382-2416(+)
MRSLTSKRYALDPELRIFRNSPSASPCGSLSISMAGYSFWLCSTPRSGPYTLSSSCSIRCCALFRSLICLPIRCFFLLVFLEWRCRSMVLAPSHSSASSRVLSSAIFSSMPRKNRMERAMTYELEHWTALAMMATVRSSVQTPRRYSSATMSVALRAATSAGESVLPLPSALPAEAATAAACCCRAGLDTIRWKKAWMARLTFSSRLPFLLTLRTSLTMWRWSISRRPLSGTHDMMRKKSSSRSRGGTAPLLRMRMRAETHALRTSRWSWMAEGGMDMVRSPPPLADDALALLPLALPLPLPLALLALPLPLPLPLPSAPVASEHCPSSRSMSNAAIRSLSSPL